MAIGLKDLKKNKTKDISSQPDNKFDFKNFAKDDAKDKVLRPWETFDSDDFQTRTLRAQEAVKRARQIVVQNEVMIDEFQDRRKTRLQEEKLNSECDHFQIEEVSEYKGLKVEPRSSHRIKVRKGFSGIFQSLLGAD
jgi:hypothetical protein